MAASKIMLAMIGALTLGGSIIPATAQGGADVPANPHLAASAWPLFHRNGYAQASGALPSIGPNTPAGFQRVDNPEGGTAPWTVLMEPYADGSQAVISNTQKGVIKWLIDGEDLRQISYLDLPRGRWDFDWNVAALANGEVVVTSIKDNRLYFLRDEQEGCAECPLVVSRQVDVPKSVGELTIHFTVSYSGHVLILMEDNKLAAISLTTGAVDAVHSLGNGGRGYSYHNAFATDETGRIFISTQNAVTAID